ncbi:MAG: HEAT repeat domain-containing protein [Planctomycetota bacterium]
MRAAGLIAVLVALAAAADAPKKVEAVSDAEAKEVLQAFEKAFKAKDVDQKLEAVYTLHDAPHDQVIERLARLANAKNPAVRNVAAMALGGQGHNPDRAGQLLMASFKKNYQSIEVLSSVLDGMAELRYLRYWPDLKKCLDDDRNAVAIRALDLIGSNQDWRAVPQLLELYKEQMPKGYKWTTGSVTVDTGTPGDADQKAAQAKWEAKYGKGGSKAKARAQAKANAGKERNLATQLRKCVRMLTGQDFETVLDFEDWLMENYVEVARKAAVLDGKDPDVAARKAASELPALKKRIEDERAKMEKEMEDNRRARETGKS